jgi:hypothetical protein
MQNSSKRLLLSLLGYGILGSRIQFAAALWFNVMGIIGSHELARFGFTSARVQSNAMLLYHPFSDHAPVTFAPPTLQIPGVVHTAAPVKQCDRVVDKGAAYQTERNLPNTPEGGLEGVGRVIDIQRCSYIVPDPETAVAICDALESATTSRTKFEPLRRKNGFAVDAESVGGYRDIKYNMLFRSGEQSGPSGTLVGFDRLVLLLCLRALEEEAM